ncbi:MAG: helix-turn-helix transcriptional regulator [Planctomycetota bacterium]
MQGYLLGYLFACFAAGVACLGVLFGLAVRRRDPVSRALLAAYAFLTVMVTASLVLALADAAPGVIPESTHAVFVYLESIVGLYGLMLTLPLLAHRVFRVEARRRERVLIAVVVVALGLQHLTEYALGSTPWDERGDRFEDGVLILLVAYALWVACSRLAADEARRPLAPRLFALLLLGTLGTAYDLYLGEATGWRLYPLWYCTASVLLTWTLVRSGPAAEASAPAAGPRAEEGWGLSERESEVAGQVALGLSNKEVAAALHISTNTVKTHLRRIFDKAGIQSRFELIARMSGSRGGHPPG